MERFVTFSEMSELFSSDVTATGQTADGILDGAGRHLHEAQQIGRSVFGQWLSIVLEGAA